MELLNKVALITGGARRVGRAIALELAEAGCDIAIHYRRSRAEAEDTARAVREAGRRAALIGADLADPASWPTVIAETVRAFARLDLLVNNASMFIPDETGRSSGPAFDHQLWRDMLEVNLIAPAALCHYASEHLAANGNGKVVNLVDIAAERPWPKHIAYCSSKAGLAAATKALARALAPTVQVNAIAPGIAVFPEEYSGELRRRLVDKVPLKREGTPGEVAKLVRFLVESGDYITGEVIAIDGGRLLV